MSTVFMIGAVFLFIALMSLVSKAIDKALDWLCAPDPYWTDIDEGDEYDRDDNVETRR